MTHPRDYVRRCANCGTPAGRHYSNERCYGFQPEPRSLLYRFADRALDLTFEAIARLSHPKEYR